MHASRDELRRLIEQLSDEEVSDVLRVLRRRRPRRPRPSLPPPGLGAADTGSTGEYQAATDWQASFTAESVPGQPGPPYLPHDLVATFAHAPPATVEAFLTELRSRIGEDIPADELWAMWERMTSH